MSLAERLVQVRKTRGMSQKQIAAWVSVNEKTWQHYEAGSTEPKVSSLRRLADMGFDLNWIITGKKKELTFHGDPETAVSAAGRDVVAELMKQTGYVLVPSYDIEASAGGGLVPVSEEVGDLLAFREGWLRELGLTPGKAATVEARGDSMEPTIRNGDLLLVDMSVNRLIDDAIYLLERDGGVTVKRVQRRFDGSIVIISDNAHYESEHLSADEATSIRISGRVCWTCRTV